MATNRPEKDREAYNRQLRAYKARCSNSMSTMAKRLKNIDWYGESEEDYW